MFSTKLKVLFRQSSNFLAPIRRCCTSPSYNLKKFIVTVVSANSTSGRMLGLLLKQNQLIKELRLFDEDESICAVASDLSHIDSNAIVRSYIGTPMLKKCIEGSDLVIITGGGMESPCDHAEKLFYRNVQRVRTIAMYLTEFNPTAVFLIGTGPVDCLVPMACEEYFKADLKNAGDKVVGCVNMTCMRANTMIARATKCDPFTTLCPLIGGNAAETVVAVISQSKAKIEQPSLADDLQKSISCGEVSVLYIKQSLGLQGGLCYLAALANSRLATSILRGLEGENSVVECAFVRQTGHIAKFLPYMTSIVRFGRHGVLCTYMPQLSGAEIQHLKRAYGYLRRNINIGQSYINGMEYKKDPVDDCTTPIPPEEKEPLIKCNILEKVKLEVPEIVEAEKTADKGQCKC